MLWVLIYERGERFGVYLLLGFDPPSSWAMFTCCVYAKLAVCPLLFFEVACLADWSPALYFFCYRAFSLSILFYCFSTDCVLSWNTAFFKLDAKSSGLSKTYLEALVNLALDKVCSLSDAGGLMFLYFAFFAVNFCWCTS